MTIKHNINQRILTLYVYTDSGSRGNPGPLTIGIVFLMKIKKLNTSS